MTADGTARFNFETGAVRVTYQPNWSSQDRTVAPGYGWGQGPGRWVKLFEAGAAGQGTFALSIDPKGTNLVFTTSDRAGNVRTNFQTRISWTYRQPSPGSRSEPVPWREVAVNYTPAYCMLIVDGGQQADWLTKSPVGPGVALPDSARMRTARLVIGGGLTDETPSIAGRVGQVETFRRPLTPMHSQALLLRTALSASIETSPPRVKLFWGGCPGVPPVVRRRPLGETNWAILATSSDLNALTDSDPGLVLGQVYEYAVDERTIIVGLHRQPSENRGRVLLLVDETLERRLTASLEQFTADLVGDGWQVTRTSAPRHDDQAWDRGPIARKHLESVRRVRSLILAEHTASDGKLNTVILIGHVAIPYSGINTEDGHFDHNGAWPADSYYGDLNHEWSDGVVNSANSIPSPVLRNVPGDGKFDPNVFNSATSTNPQPLNGIEVAVGRIDFANLPAFRNLSETELLQRYFDKDHRYRHGELGFTDTAVIGGFFYSPFNPDSLSVYDNGAWTLSRLVGLDWTGVRFGDAFAPGVSALWGIQGGYGNPNTLHNNPAANTGQGISAVSATTLAARRTGPAVAFHLLKGSYFGDWNLGPNNFMRAVLAVPDGGLASLWFRDTVWRTEALAAGEPLGTALLRSAQGSASTRTTYLLGDPTLRMAVVKPPRDVKAVRTGDSVRLTWISGTVEAIHHVYRATTASGPFARLSQEPLATSFVSDATASKGRQFYQVRALALTTTGSGTYTNLSQAVVVSVN